MTNGSDPATPTTFLKGQMTETSAGEFNLATAIPDRKQRVFRFEKSDRMDFLGDEKSEMTWGRRIALHLMKYTWYYPKARESGDEVIIFDCDASLPNPDDHIRLNKESPSLEKAWAYFEHVSLYRYITEKKEEPKNKKSMIHRIVRKFQKSDKKLEKAEPGEDEVKTTLYSPIFTPHAQLGDFGLGIGLYFSTLRAITVITFVLGLISVYNINYFSSDAYLPKEYRDLISSRLIKGSAICTNTPWVLCPECECAMEDERLRRSNIMKFEYNRCGIGSNEEVENVTFVLKNDCDATPWQLGAVNYATVIVLLVATAGLGEYLRRQEIQFDEDEQTAQDYSIRITNPPKDAHNPEEWRKFFEERCGGAQATVCTVAVDNDLLIRTLVERRMILRQMENTLEPGSSMGNLHLAYVAAKTERERSWVGHLLASVSPGIPEYYSRYVALNAKVQGLAQLDYDVTNVFVTFETEKDQRQVLKKLSVGYLQAMSNDKRALADSKYLFRDEFVLAVEEPDEPSTIRWQDLNAGFIQKLKEQTLTVIATLFAIVGVALVVRIANESSTVGAAFAISGFNSGFPIFAKLLTDLEAHASEGEKQTSLYFKIAAFRWVNTAIVITIITPFTDTLANEGGLIPQIYALFFAEILTVSAIQLADPSGHLNRHFLAPRASTQDAMNLMFSGTEYELAERYTDMTKILFLCVWYCSIFPAAFFLCSFTLGVKYFVDRFSLMRTWKRAPQLGTRVSKFSRRYFFSLACVAMSIMGSYYWSGFPYDNLCELEQSGFNYTGFFNVIANDDSRNDVVVEVQYGDLQYRFCSQDLMSQSIGNRFPFIPGKQPEGGEWMTPDQEEITTIFGWSSVAIIAILLIKFFWGWIEMVQDLFRSSYSSVGDDQNIPFSDVQSPSTYIPQVQSPLFAYPLIATDSGTFDDDLYEWKDPDRSYSWYDLTKDAEKLLIGMGVSKNFGFSRVQHWPPKQD